MQPFGSADFKLVKNGALTASVETKANSKNIDILAGLPDNTKTAIMLEPFAMDFVNNHKATDLKTTVFKTLTDNGYATIRYTDSAVSKDKFSNLGKNNVVLVDSHMGWDADTQKYSIIGLSTGKGGWDSRYGS